MTYWLSCTPEDKHRCREKKTKEEAVREWNALVTAFGGMKK
jgi:hypothetical protein